MTKEAIQSILKQIDQLAYDMRYDRHDGYYKEHCRECLKEICDHINKVLEK